MTDIQNIIAQLEQRKTAIESAITALRGIGDEATAVTRGPGRPKGSVAAKHTGLTEGRQRQIEAMRRYWAAKKKGAKKAAPRKAAGGITPEGRKRLAEMMRKRWAAKRASAKKAAKKG